MRFPYHIISDASSFISSELNLQLQQSLLKPYSQENWQKFCLFNDFDNNSSGLYVPQSYSAYVNTESPFLTSNIFLELFGHGLFCEYSQIGQELVENAEKGNDANGFLHAEINPDIQPLGLAKQNIGNYEGFAVWMEALLCEAMGEKKSGKPKRKECFHFIEHCMNTFGMLNKSCQDLVLCRSWVLQNTILVMKLWAL